MFYGWPGSGGSSAFANSRPGTVFSCNLGACLCGRAARRRVSARIPSCGVRKYASTGIRAFLDLAKESLVSALEPCRSHPGPWMGTHELYSWIKAANEATIRTVLSAGYTLENPGEDPVFLVHRGFGQPAPARPD